MQSERHRLAIGVGIGLLLLFVLGSSGLAEEAQRLAASEPVKPAVAAPVVVGFALGDVLTLSNEFIAVGVTQRGQGIGRFALETTGGDPERQGSAGKPLIYGRPRPWTSYTTVQVDGANYVFGGKSDRRAGHSGVYGQVTASPIIKGGAIVTSGLLGGVEVTQTLELAKSSTTGLPDSLRIVYRLENRSPQSHHVGVRVMLDTMLGDNDGAPFRIGEHGYTADASFSGKTLPQFWQAFDSLSAPKVTVQGTIDDATTTRPDDLVVSNWGNFADHPWKVDLNPGQDFTRSGEDELDSAVALYWDAKPLAPGESREYVTALGLGGITVSPGELALGVTAPARVAADLDGRTSFPVVAYVESTGKGPARDTHLKIELPDGLTLAPGQKADRRVGDLQPGSQAAAVWNIIGDHLSGHNLDFAVVAQATGVKANRVGRTVQVLAPPRLLLEMPPPPVVRLLGDNFSIARFPVTVTVANTGSDAARLVKLALQPANGFILADYEKSEKYLGTLEPGESRQVSWVVVPVPGSGASGFFRVSATAANARQAELERATNTPSLPAKVSVAGPDGKIGVGRAFRVTIDTANVTIPDTVQFDVRFDPQRLVVVGYSRGDAFVNGNGEREPFTVEAVDNAAGVVRAVSGKPVHSGVMSANLLTLHMLAKASGEAGVSVSSFAVSGRPGTERVDIANLSLEISEP